ncbi:MAG: DUF1839 family protein [Proteobacteria bacterium]|nr:DUF1839 family protein [Pseudomonadota bacterium]
MPSASSADVLKLDAATWRPQALHAGERIWLETNCYIDVWAELLPALGHPAEAALGFTVRQDFEGDHFTFFKFPPGDLETLFGLSVQELAIYDSLEDHTLDQLTRGRPLLIEVDSHWLPDATPSYRQGHAKTTLAAVAIDPAARRLGYFHNTGYHVLSDADYDGLFRTPSVPDGMFPYVEFVKRDGAALSGTALVDASLDLLRGHLKHRPRSNPIAAWRREMPRHLERLAARDMAFFHLYAFNLPRQLGANFEMLATYLDWLGAHGQDGLADTAAAGRRIAEAAKAVQFQLARMVNRRKFDVAAIQFAPMEADYDTILSTLAKRFP